MVTQKEPSTRVTDAMMNGVFSESVSGLPFLLVLVLSSFSSSISCLGPVLKPGYVTDETATMKLFPVSFSLN